MAWCYRRRLKVIPGVYLNFSKSGISTSIGGKGARLTFGKNGIYSTVSIPGTGLYNREKIRSFSDGTPPSLYPQEKPKIYYHEDYSFNQIVTKDILSVTSQTMEGVKETINLAHEQRIIISQDISEIKKKIFLNKFKSTILHIIYPLVKNKITEIKENITIQKNTVKELSNELDQCYVNFDIEFDHDILKKYTNLIESFKELSNSAKIWDITSFRYEDRVRTRSAASKSLNRSSIKFGIRSLPEIKTQFDTLYMKNANGGDLFFYPNFIVMYASKKEFGIIDIQDLELTYENTSFIESEPVPSDSKILYYTWDKVNKDGSRDKRFKNNYQIPVVSYGTIDLISNKGVNEEYQFSNNEATLKFADAYNEYKQILLTK